MITYPSIPRAIGQSFRHIADAIIFDKLDGSNIRVEWMGKKKGWVKFGTRRRLLDPKDPELGDAVSIFMNDWADELESIFIDQRWQRGVVFLEFWGDESFAGNHKPDDPKRLTLIDVAPHKRGILGPRDFLRTFGHLDVPAVIDRTNWTREYVDMVWRGDVDGITFEGVVAKSGSDDDLVMAKAKTKLWVEKVRTAYPGNDANRIISS